VSVTHAGTSYWALDVPGSDALVGLDASVYDETVPEMLEARGRGRRLSDDELAGPFDPGDV